ncbi:MAG: DUF6445 family protein [Povalibacter sp.]
MNALASRTMLLGSSISVRLQRLGQEQQSVLIVDDVLADPQQLIEQASATQWYTPEHTHYPGINARLPEAYYQTVVTALRGPLEAAFGLPANAHLKYFGFFGLATTQARDATPIQKVPHHDSCEPDRLAMVHYLCQGSFGGTGFFRHRSTSYESVDGARDDHYAQLAKSELKQLPELAAFAASKHYELIGEVECVFNRLIVYRSHVLHCAMLGNETLSSDPFVGRLTANGFLEEVSTPHEG